MTLMNPADSATIGSYLTQIKHGDTATRLAAVQQAALVGTEALPQLGAIYSGGDPAAGKAAYEAIKKIVYNAGRPGAAAEAKSASSALLELASSQHPRYVRADAIQLLGVVGGDDEAKALAAMISDTDLGEDARMALERIPGKAADDALKSAARSASPERRAAIDLSLRHRKLKRNELGVKK